MPASKDETFRPEFLNKLADLLEEYGAEISYYKVTETISISIGADDVFEEDTGSQKTFVEQLREAAKEDPNGYGLQHS